MADDKAKGNRKAARATGKKKSSKKAATRKNAAPRKPETPAPEALGDMRRILETTMDAIPDLIGIQDTNHRIIRYNQAGCEMLGLNDPAADHCHCYELIGRKAPCEDCMTSEVYRTLQSAETDRYVEAMDKWFHCRAYPVLDDHGQLIRVIEHLRDITEEKNRREALEHNEKKYRHLFEYSRQGILIHDVHGNIQDANIEAERMLGYARADLKEMNLRSLVGEPEQALVDQALKQLNEEGQQRLVIMMRRKHGASFPVELSTGIFSRDGDVLAHALMYDLTEQRRFEQSLRDSESKYRILVENQTDLIVQVDADGCFTFVSPSYCDLFGKTEQELLGRPYLPLVHEGDREPTERAVEQLKYPPHTCYVEQRAWTRFGWRWLGWSDHAVIDHNGNIEHIVGVGRDITLRKEAESERELLSAAIEQAAETILITDRQGRIQYVNPAFERTSGYSREEVVGRTPRLLNSGQQPKSFYEALWKRIAGGEMWSGHLINRRKDGSLFEEEACISPVRKDGGDIDGFVAVKRDVTRERELHQQLLQSQKMEAIGQLAGGVAHDFNNLLLVIKGNIELMDLLSEEEQKGALVDIEAAVDRAAALTRQLLAFSRKQSIQPRVTRLAYVIDNMHKLLDRLLGEDVSLQVNIIEPLCNVIVDVGQIEQVLMNIAVNARDAMPQGGALTIEAMTKTVKHRDLNRRRDLQPGEYALLTISDTGSGIPESIIDYVFEPFFTTKGRSRGTGLGLSVAYGIVKQHQGYIYTSNNPEGGALFEIYLPACSEAEESAADHMEQAKGLSGEGKRILVVEDEDPVRLICARSLRSRGFTVDEAASAEEARELILREDRTYDLLFVDIVLPGENGAHFAESIRSERPELPILLTSGYTDERINLNIPQQRQFPLIHKPYDLSLLYAMLARELNDTRSTS